VVGVATFSDTRNSSTRTMNITVFSPTPATPLSAPPSNPAVTMIACSGTPHRGMPGDAARKPDGSA
jgi:hypothetical protein